MKFFGAFSSLQALVLSSLNSNPFASQAAWPRLASLTPNPSPGGEGSFSWSKLPFLWERAAARSHAWRNASGTGT